MRRLVMFAIIFIIVIGLCFADGTSSPVINNPTGNPTVGDKAELPVSFNLPGITPVLRAGFMTKPVDNLESAYSIATKDFLNSGISLSNVGEKIVYDGELYFFYFAYGGDGLNIKLSASPEMTDTTTGKTIAWNVDIEKTDISKNELSRQHHPGTSFATYASCKIDIEVPDYLEGAAGIYSGDLVIDVETN